jgi:drug/metabolite transporter (DMT)-like permease
MAETLAILAALSFALGTTLQQRGTLQTRAEEGDPRFLLEILHEPVWLLGALIQAVGWFLQAVALDQGSLVAVQALCTLSLVFALPLGVWLTDQTVSRWSVIGAVTATVGIVVFVAVAQTSGGTDQPSSSSWWTAALVIAAVTIVLSGFARRTRGASSASLYATAAGLGFAFQAAVTKVFVTVVGDGLGPILSSWTTYALIASALVGFALQQSALKTGFLAPAMAASNASTLVVSVMLGVTVFDETIHRTSSGHAPALIGLVGAVVGVIILAVAQPQSETSPAAQQS